MQRHNITDDGDYLDWFYKKLISILEDELKELICRFNKCGILPFDTWHFNHIYYVPATRYEDASIQCTFQLSGFRDFKYNLIIYPTAEKIIDAILLDILFTLIAKLYPALQLPGDPPSVHAKKMHIKAQEDIAKKQRNNQYKIIETKPTIYENLKTCLQEDKFDLERFKSLRMNHLAYYELHEFRNMTQLLPGCLVNPFHIDTNSVIEKIFNEDIIFAPRDLSSKSKFIYLSGDDPLLGANMVAHRIPRSSANHTCRFFLPHGIKEPLFRFFTSDKDLGPTTDVKHVKPEQLYRKLLIDNPANNKDSTGDHMAAIKNRPRPRKSLESGPDLPNLRWSI